VTAAAGAPLQLHAPAKSAKASAPAARPGSDQIAALIERHAIQHGVPSALAHRVVMRESRYNPAARNRAYWGLMQIRHDTARSLGYSGAPEGLLDPDVNLRYGMAYLGNAYRVAGGDQSHAVALYSRGYYFEAKRKGMLGQLRKADSAPVAEANAR
jgi:soluble lytic murein transglycosylase-like protein